MILRDIVLGDIYKGSFFSRRKSLVWRAPIVCNAVIKAFNLQTNNSIIDAGCAIGEYVDWFQKNGYRSIGIEGSINAIDYLLTDSVEIDDLRRKLVGYKRYSVCMSLEVAEHIEEKYAHQYAANLALLSNQVLLTAAPKGQGGHYHVNCQPKEYWIAMFNTLSYTRDKSKEEIFKDALNPFKHRKEIASYFNNALIFKRS